MALLDWENAVDKVQHDKLYIARERLGFSKHYIDVIEDCYMNPAFFVRDNFGKSENWNNQQGSDKDARYRNIYS